MSQMIINNRYHVIETIGKGAMGVVSKVQDRLNGEVIALKRVTVDKAKLDFATLQDTRDIQFALAREFKVLASLRHPHIISVLDYGFDDERHPFFTMELIENRQTITAYNEQITLQDRLTLITQILQALAYLHRRDIIHRDLKPDNVMVVNGQVKVLDFGLALAREHIEEGGGIAGTIAYMAPETLNGKVATPQSDLYAVGVIAYELLAGHHPYDTNTIQGLITDILYNKPNVETVDVSVEIQVFLERLLAKDAQSRFQSAQEAMHALAEASGKQTIYETPSIRESYLQSARFVGRERELDQLIVSLLNTKQNQGSAFIISGEAGVGKSRLIDELRTHALVNNVLVLRGQGVANASLPYQLWRDVVRYMLLILESISDVDVAILREVVPDIEAILDREVSELPNISGQESRQRVNGAIVDLFQAVKRPILLIMEDLQWALESLEPLQPLIKAVSSLPLMIIGTFRTEENPNLPQQLPGATLLPLERLNADNIANLSAAILGKDAAVPQVVKFLHGQTEGNTLFLIEIIRELARGVDELSEIAQMTLPETVFTGGVQQIIQRRLERVPNYAQPMLYTAATLGREIDRRLITHLAIDIDLEQWLTSCADTSILEVQDDTWRFTHDKIRETLITNQTPAQRMDNHRLVAEAIEAVYPNQPEQAFVLAYHWRHAGNVQKEIHYACIAGEQQLKRSVFNEAMWFFSRALQITPGKSFISRRERARLTMMLGEAHLGVTEYDRAETLFSEALTEISRLDDPALLADVLQKIGILNVKRGNYEEAEAVFLKSIQHARAVGDQLGLARTLGHLGELEINNGRYADAKDHLEESLHITRQLNDPGTTTLTLRSMGKMHYQQGDIDGGRVFIHEAQETAYAIGDRYGVARAINALGVFAATQNNYRDARVHYQDAVTIFSQIGDRWGEAVIKNNLAFVNMLDGDFQQAGPLFYDAIQDLRSIAVIPVMLETMVGIARILVAVGHYQQAGEILGLAYNHPAKIEDVDTLAQHANDALHTHCSQEDIQQWMAQGQQRDLDDMIMDVLEERKIVLNNLRD